MAGSTRSPVMPFLVSFGGENLLLDRDIERARAWSGREVTILDAIGLTDVELVSLLETSSADGSPRTIVLDEAQKLKGDKVLRSYIDNKTVADLSTVLVAVVRSEKLPEVWASAVSKGKGYEHKKLKTWDAGKEFVKWVGREALRVGLCLDNGIDQFIYNYVGPDLYRLASELQKLSLIVPRNAKVTKEHLALVTSPSPQSDPFQVAEAAISKDPKAAMNALSILVKNTGDDSLVPIVYALMKQVEKTLLIRRMIDKGLPESEMASSVGMKEWPFTNFALPVAKKHSSTTLAAHMGRLCKLDADVKGSARSKRTLVELAVLAIAAG